MAPLLPSRGGRRPCLPAVRLAKEGGRRPDGRMGGWPDGRPPGALKRPRVEPAVPSGLLNAQARRIWSDRGRRGRAPLGAFEAASALRFLRLFAAKLPWLRGSPTPEVLPQRAQRAQRKAVFLCGLCVLSGENILVGVGGHPVFLSLHLRDQ